MPVPVLIDVHGCTWRRQSTGLYAAYTGPDPNSMHFGLRLTAAEIRALPPHRYLNEEPNA